MLEILARRMKETERKLQEVEISPQGLALPLDINRLPRQDMPITELPPPIEKRPTTLAGQLIRNDITQGEYNRAIREKKPLTGKQRKNEI